ncbi:hypothetical protein C8Q74DRAFT_804292 [Fomes fomentarius]|nr:hypothetical protein C8Q74DRAFT_804292 [Fomes fomentarius]
MLIVPSLPRSLNASQIEFAYDAASESQFHGEFLSRLWFRLGYVLIDGAMQAAHLGIMTALAGVAMYVTILKGRKSFEARFPLYVIVIQWASSVSATVRKLSYATELYSLLGSDIQHVNTNLKDVVNCVEALNCVGSGIDMIQPAYTMHICVGTAAQAANFITTVALTCLCTWSIVKTKPAGGVLLALFVGTCSTAMMHIENTCWPVGGEIRVVDSVTQTLVLVTTTLSAAMLILWFWKNWRAVKSNFTNGGGSGNRRLLLVVSLPLVLMQVVSSVHKHLDGRSTSILVYTLLSASDNIIVPLSTTCEWLASYIMIKLDTDSNAGTDEKLNAPLPQCGPDIVDIKHVDVTDSLTSPPP